jgi:hypothetical protein
VEGGGENDYVWPTDPIGKSDVSGRWWLEDVARAITDSDMGKAALFACGFVPGWIGLGCAAVETAAYVIQGRMGDAALSAATTGAAFFGARAVAKVMSTVSAASVARQTAHVALDSATPSRRIVRNVTRQVQNQVDWVATAPVQVATFGLSEMARPYVTVIRYNWGNGRWAAW